MRKTLFSALWLACALTAASANAQEAPQPAAQNGITYLKGGIGLDESTAIRAQAPHYSLRLLFASKRGGYLSDVDVGIASADGRTLLSVHTDGPFLYVQLAAGQYTVTARGYGVVDERSVTIRPGRAVDLSYHWDVTGYTHRDACKSNCPPLIGS